jgi:hypothetical protein
MSGRACSTAGCTTIRACRRDTAVSSSHIVEAGSRPITFSPWLNAIVRPAVSRFTIPMPAGPFSQNNEAQAIAVSPRGTHVVYGSGAALWLRPLAGLDATAVAGTETTGAHSPLFLQTASGSVSTPRNS